MGTPSTPNLLGLEEIGTMQDLPAASGVAGTLASYLRSIRDGLGGGAAYSLLINAAATGSSVTGVSGGAYIFSVAGTFGGTSVQLQSLGPDGATWINVGTAVTTAGSQGVVIGNNATLQVLVTGGSPSGLYANLS